MMWLNFSENLLLAALSWQLGLGICISAAAAIAFKKAQTIDPASRYGVWTSAFLTIALLPLVAFWPAQENAQPIVETNPVTTPIQEEASLEVPFILPTVSSKTTPTAVPFVTSQETISGPEMAQKTVPFSIDAPTTQSGMQFSWQQEGKWLLLGLWALVAAFLLLKLASGIQALRKLKRDAQSLEGPLNDWFQNTLVSLDIGRNPRLMQHAGISSPLVAGLFKPAVLVPQSLLSDLNEDELQQLLLHELGHIKRWDDWVHLCQKTLLALFWYNPSLHWFSKKMAWDRESACDQWAVHLTGKSKQYAYSLLRVSESMHRTSSSLLTVGAVHGKKQLSHRIETLMDKESGTRRVGYLTKLGICLLLAGSVATMALAGPNLILKPLQPSASATPQSEEEEAKKKEELLAIEREHLEKAQEQLKRQEKELLLKSLELEKAQRQLKRLEKEAARRAAAETAKPPKPMPLDNKALKEEMEQLRQEMTRREQELNKTKNAEMEKAHRQLKRLEKEMARSAVALAEVPEPPSPMGEDQTELQSDIESLRQEMKERSETMKENQERQEHSYEQMVAQQREAIALASEITALSEARSQELEQDRTNRASAFAISDMARQRSYEKQLRSIEKQKHSLAQRERALAGRAQHISSMGTASDGGLVYGSDIGTSTTQIKQNDLGIVFHGKVVFSDDESSILSISQGGYFKFEDHRDRRDRHWLKVKPGKDGNLVYQYKHNRKKKPFDAHGKAWLKKALPNILLETGVGAKQRVKRVLADQGVDGVLALVSEIRSDHAKDLHLTSLVSTTTLNKNEIRSIMGQVSNVHSDFNQARIMIALAQNQANSNELAGEISKAMASIHSDFEKRRVLEVLIPQIDTKKSMSKILGVVNTINSDFEKRFILEGALEHWQFADLKDSGFLDVLSQINSDHELGQMIATISKKENLTRHDTQKLAAVASQNISSDFELARVLKSMQKQLAVDKSFANFLRQIHSDHIKSETLMSFLNGRQLSEKEQLVWLECAATIRSDHSLAQVLHRFRSHNPMSKAVAKEFQSRVNRIGSEHVRSQFTEH